MRRLAGISLTTASLFLAVVAITQNSPALFYMGTALIATILACRLQSYLSIRALRFERVAPESVRVGDLVTVEITVWSERKIRRPLVTIEDNLPPRLLVAERSASLPIAPAYDLPIRTQYQFRPLKRGRYRWSGLTVTGTDALGLIPMSKTYETMAAEVTVLPSPIPVQVEMPSAAGWGLSEAQSGHARGAGMEPRGIREYRSGDSLRHVHWPSSSRAGQLLVKEFEAGTHAAAAMFLQDQKDTDIGEGADTSLERIVGNAVYLAEVFLRQGAKVVFPQFEGGRPTVAHTERLSEIYEVLAGVTDSSDHSLGKAILSTRGDLPLGSVVFALAAVADPDLILAADDLKRHGLQMVAMLYDGPSFAAKKSATRFKSATDPLFVEQLRSAGAQPVIVPTDREIIEIAKSKGKPALAGARA
jgi:uncharacterized protein (DUF58 family)